MFKNGIESSVTRRVFSRMPSVLLLTALGLGVSVGCTTMNNPAKRLVNHLSTKASEAKMRDQVEKDKFPTAKEAGVD
jgi:hypothetical protein